MQLQHGRNPNIGSNSQQMTSTNRTGKGQGSKRIENANENQRSGKLLRICKFLLEVHLELQSYSKAIKQPEMKKGMEMGRRTAKGFQGAKRQDYQLAGTLSSKEGRKIQSGNECFRTCYWRSIILRTGREMETDSLPIQNDATSRKKL